LPREKNKGYLANFHFSKSKYSNQNIPTCFELLRTLATVRKQAFLIFCYFTTVPVVKLAGNGGKKNEG
jgi:hypothetical protein